MSVLLRRRWMRPVLAAIAAAVIAWFPFVAGREVPVLDLVDLGVHEAGHLLAFFLPELAMFLAGSVLQVALPLLLALYFWTGQRDAAGAGVCAAWAGTSAWDVSIYIADAPFRTLPLIGGGEHDWAWILGPRGFDSLDSAGVLAGYVEGAGLLVAIAGIGVALSPLVRTRRPGSIGGISGTAVPRPVRVPHVPVEGDPWSR